MKRQSRFMIAAAGSGSGKTIVSCGLMSALLRRGMKVVACKCGPDYIDPMFHREVLAMESQNLDLFFCEEEKLREIFKEHTAHAEVAVTEGVMGYYDGMGIETDKASSYHVARTLRLPVILTVSCKGMALSVVPVILGMISYRKDSNIQGILLNRVSKMVYPRMKAMIEEELQKRGIFIPVVGYVPEDSAFALESRHLGLVMPEEMEHIKGQIKKAGEILEETVDIDRILHIGTQWNSQESSANKKITKAEKKENAEISKTIKIAIARDEAFCFYYKENLKLLEKLGCELIRFSPLHDQKLPRGVCGVILGGGYPELYAQELSDNKDMLYSVRAAVKAGMPCLAECGGFMYLHENMEGSNEIFYPMAGVIKGKAYKTKKLVRFGYIGITPLEEGEYLKKGEELKGHEFHYWDSTSNGESCLAAKPSGNRSFPCIHMEGTLFAGYPHIHYYSNPAFAGRFVRSCQLYEVNQIY